MYFMRVSTNLAKIVKLTIRVFQDVAAFTVFMIFWITVFMQIYIITGITLFENQDETYAKLTSPVALWIQSFRNSLGDINNPVYTYWSDNENAHEVTV